VKSKQPADSRIPFLLHSKGFVTADSVEAMMRGGQKVLHRQSDAPVANDVYTDEPVMLRRAGGRHM